MKSRFNFNANTLDEAKDYIFSRSKQLLRHYFKLIDIQEYQWGVSAIFEKDGRKYQSMYILEDYRNKGLYSKNIQYTILTSNECNIEDYLISKNIDYICVSLEPFVEYKIISDFYRDEKTNRSKVYLMNHIDEGLYILEKIGASEVAKKAYCLHPIVQSDESLYDNYNLLDGIDNKVIISAMEYRSVANEYLSTRSISSISEIRLSPIEDVNHMLIADKIQNKKDFDLYHKGMHIRSNQLEEYFNNWFKRLDITENFYSESVQYCQLKLPANIS